MHDGTDNGWLVYTIRVSLLGIDGPTHGTRRGILPEIDSRSKPVVFIRTGLKIYFPGEYTLGDGFITPVESIHGEGKIRVSAHVQTGTT
nr:MAG TPA: hypothetical protein [Caudoviricetes sp.]